MRRTMSKVPPARASTPKSPTPAATSPATHVTVFTVLERSGGLAGRAEGAILLLSVAGFPFVFTVKNTLPVWRVKWAGGYRRCYRISGGLGLGRCEAIIVRLG